MSDDAFTLPRRTFEELRIRTGSAALPDYAPCSRGSFAEVLRRISG